MADYPAHRVQFGFGFLGEHHGFGARIGIEEQERTIIHHQKTYFMPELAMPVVMKRCRKAKTMVTGSSVTTVIASTKCHCT